MWEARQFLPMLVKTVRELRNHLAATVTQDTRESPYSEERDAHTHIKKKKIDIFTCKMETCTPTHQHFTSLALR